LDQKSATGREAQNNLAAGFSSIKISFGEEDTDTRPDTAFTVGGMQRVHNITDMAALLVCNSTEDIDLDVRGHKDFRGCKGYFFHVFHMIVLVIVVKKTLIAERFFSPSGRITSILLDV